jgi:BolA protein
MQLISDQMTERLQSLTPTQLEIFDESESHRGHSGFREGGESHFRIRMASLAFAGLSRIQKHRLVHETLGDIVTRVHALALELTES